MDFSRFALLPVVLLAQLVPLPLAGLAVAKPVTLPHSAPVPEQTNRPDEKSGAKPGEQSDTPPVPQPRPDDSAGQPTSPADAPLPSKKPEADLDTNDADKDAAKPTKPLTDPRSTTAAADKMPDEELTCRKSLNALGVVFEDRKAEFDAAAGCSLPYPISAKSLGPSIGLAPEALMNCQMAEAAARFMKDVVSPAAKAHLDSQVKSINQASAYVCRPRHNGQKMSEHAFGNALDIASFTLQDDTVVKVGAALPEKQAKFLDDIRKQACGPFKTVLGPGSDADHAEHLHFDLEPRRNGGTFCQ